MAQDTERKHTSRKPRFIDDEAYRYLRSGNLTQFHQMIAGRESVDFSDSDLRGTDLRGADLRKVVLRGSYLRDADLRGLDLSHMDMSGCSLHNAKISGTFFPDSLDANEIRLSIDFGTRVRNRPK